MRTFSITTLGCRVNHYEGEQLATLCRAMGLRPAPADRADVRIVHTCSVTVQAASKSGQAVRRSTRLNVLGPAPDGQPNATCAGETNPATAVQAVLNISEPTSSSVPKQAAASTVRPRVVVTGCWATSNPAEAAALPGVDAVLGHHEDVGEQLAGLLGRWRTEAELRTPENEGRATQATQPRTRSTLPEPVVDEKWMMQRAGIPAALITTANEPHYRNAVKGKLEGDENPREAVHEGRHVSGMMTLPQLDARQAGHQRAFLKVQDGCDAHCTYCIIPQLRPQLWSKPVDEAVEEARRLVDAGHVEIVLTGIFLGAYAQPTALRRRQTVETAVALGGLVEALCTRVRGLRRLRLSSMEPGDLTPELLQVLKSHPQVVPHFHLPLQSGSDAILRRMNRQYTRDDFLRMLDHLNGAFDRPAITTDIIVGFPGETEAEFAQTVDVVERVRFIHTHAFSYSPRPRTAAARWTREFVRGPVVNERINALRELAAKHSETFRRQFIGEVAEVLVEGAEELEAPRRHNPASPPAASRAPISTGLFGSSFDSSDAAMRHGRSERYFPIHFASDLPPGAAARVRITRVTPAQTLGQFLEPRPEGASP